MNTSKRLNPKIISMIVIVLIALATTGIYAATQGSKTETTTTSDTTAETTQTTPSTDSTATTGSTDTDTSAAATSSYKDGTYTETGNYNTPGGSESVTVTVTLANGAITDVSTTGSATRGESSEYQEKFLSAYKTSVVGKSIDAVKLSRVAGSSLTSTGFNTAIEKIKDDATA